MSVTMLQHGRTELALHELRAGEGRPLLHLHGLAERAPAEAPGVYASCPRAAATRARC